MLCYLFVLQIAEAAKTSSQVDDLYLDDTGSGGYYPEDDDDFNSGSGSGKKRIHTETRVKTHTYMQAQQAITQRRDDIHFQVCCG